MAITYSTYLVFLLTLIMFFRVFDLEIGHFGDLFSLCIRLFDIPMNLLLLLIFDICFTGIHNLFQLFQVLMTHQTYRAINILQKATKSKYSVISNSSFYSFSTFSWIKIRNFDTDWLSSQYLSQKQVEYTVYWSVQLT